jgi:hypothetical protein
MALPLVGKPRTQSKGSDQAARWLAVSLLTVWGLRVPCGLLAVWLVVGTGWPAGTILLGVCVAGAYGLHRSGRLVPLYRHERLHWRAHTALVLCDPKRVELAHWRPRASVVATDMDSIDLVLARTVLLVRDRFEQMERHGIQLLEPSAHHPHVVLVVEELAILNLGGTGKQSTDRRALVNELAFTARAASVSLIVATQQPNARTIPTDIRGQMTRRIAHATASWDESKMILGDNPAPAHLLSMAQQGTVYVAADGTRKATLARAYMLDGDQAAGIARQTAHLRVGPEVVGMPALAMPAFPDAIEID